MEAAVFNARVKAVAALVASFVTALANVMGWSPTIVSANLIDLIASAVCAVAAIYFYVKRPVEPTA